MKKIFSVMMAMVMVMSVFTSCKSDDEDGVKEIDKGMIFGTWEITSVLGIDVETGESELQEGWDGTQIAFNAQGQYARVKGDTSLDFLEPAFTPPYRGKWVVTSDKILVTPKSTTYDFDLKLSKNTMTWEGYYNQYIKVKLSFKKVSDSTDM